MTSRLDEATPDFESMVQKVYEATLRPGDAAVDIGAHTGRHSIPMARKVAGGGKVYAVEPLPMCRDALAATIQSQPCLADTITILPYALGASSDTTEFVVAEDALAYSGLRERHYDVPTRLTRIRVKVRRFDEVFGHLPALRFIKLDAEGGEYHILEGARRSLRAFRPVVAFEFGANSISNYGITPADMANLLTRQAYRIFSITGQLLTNDMFVTSSLEQNLWDYVAVPAEMNAMSLFPQRPEKSVGKACCADRDGYDTAQEGQVSADAQLAPTVGKHYANVFHDYGCSFREEGLLYLQTHLARFLLTLELLALPPGARVLEVGSSPSYTFTLMLLDRFPSAEVVVNDGVMPKRQPQEVVLDPTAPGRPTVRFASVQFNAETERWPFPDDRFDVVLFMEVLEHLQRDPYLVVREAHRVLAPSGRFVLTTPNIACWESLAALRELQSPYTYGVYSRHGPSGRHNREYVPSEVELLARSGGFATELLTTKDCYGRRSEVSQAVSVLRGREGPNDLRGQTIFYVGRKAGGPAPFFPSEFYDYDPADHCCEIIVAGPPQRAARNYGVLVEIRLRNRGRLVWWTKEGDETRLGVQLLDSNEATISKDFRRFSLPHDVRPGEEAETTVAISLAGAPRECILRFDLVHEMVTWFSDVWGNRAVDVSVSE